MAVNQPGSQANSLTSDDAALTPSVSSLAYTALSSQPLNDSIVMWMGE
jgi:hypothetical protein